MISLVADAGCSILDNKLIFKIPARHCLVCAHCNLGTTQALAGGLSRIQNPVSIS